MVHILEGSSEHVAHAHKKCVFSENINRILTALELTKCLKQIKYQRLLLRAHLFSIESIMSETVHNNEGCVFRVSRSDPDTYCKQGSDSDFHLKYSDRSVLSTLKFR